MTASCVGFSIISRDHGNHGSDMSASIVSAMMATELSHYQPKNNGQIYCNSPTGHSPHENPLVNLS